MIINPSNSTNKKYIWLNPVITSSYNYEDLFKTLNKIGFEIVTPHINHLKIVLEKYKKELSNLDKPILDKRCPLIVEYFSDKKEIFKDVNIDPILIHISRELSDREDLSDGIKYILTPCFSLKKMGEELNLQNTIFYTWDDFVREYNISINGNKLDISPIPLGFFSSISDNVLKITKNNLKQDKDKLKRYDIVEGLYCLNGCHNGDGVRCIKRKKQ